MIKILFAFEGRVGRLNYLLGLIALNLVATALLYIMMLSLGGIGVVLAPLTESGGQADPEAVKTLVAGIGIVGLVMFVLILGLTLYSSTAIQVKRLHDMNVSGWFYLLNFSSIPAVIFAAELGPVSLFLFLLPLGLGIACLFFPGTRGPNQFGETQISIFDIADSEDGDWQDRVESYKDTLKGKQLAKSEEAAEGPVRTRPRRQSAARSGGFGRRGIS